MRIFLTGGTGFLGTALALKLAARGHKLVMLTRDARFAENAPEGALVIVGDPARPGPWWDAVAGCDAAVNLAGAPVVGRWTEEFKRVLHESRVVTTKNLVAAIPRNKPFTLFSASAVGFYGDAGEKWLEEDAPSGSDFLASVAREWEEEAQKARGKGARVIIGRLAVVLGREGGILQELFRNARAHLSSTIGDGKQWVSWIHIEDAAEAIISLLESSDAEGVYNLGAPEPVRQGELGALVNREVGAKAPLRLPRFMLKLMLGDFAENLRFGQRMRPARLTERGFKFSHADLKENLKELL